MFHPQTIRIILITVLSVCVVFALYQAYRFYSVKNDYTNVPAGYAYAVPNATLDVVSFLDYGCPWCRKIEPILMEAARRDGRVRVVPRILPHRNSDAALLLYAAAQQNAFIPMHEILIKEDWAPSTENIRSLAARLAINPLKLESDFYHERTKEIIRDNIEAYDRVNTKATPTFIIGKRVFVPSDTMPTADDFMQMFDEARDAR